MRSERSWGFAETIQAELNSLSAQAVVFRPIPSMQTLTFSRPHFLGVILEATDVW